MTDPSWSAGDEVPVKILVLKDADGPDGLAATTTLVVHTTQDGWKYETRNLTLTWSAPTSGGNGDGLPGGVPARTRRSSGRRW